MISVIKVGGDVVANPELRHGFAAELAELHAAGHRLVVLHGGGPQATRLTKRLGLKPNIVGGRRITDAEVLEVMKMTLAGQVNVDLTAACRAAGVPGLGISAVSGVVSAVKRPPRTVSGCGPDPVDFGEVGDVTGVDHTGVAALLDAGFVPLISSLSADPTGRVLNINADIVACDMAIGLGAANLALLTGANGVMRELSDPTSRYPRLTIAEATALIQTGIVAGGMIPKLEEAFRVLRAGVAAVHILPAGRPGALAGALKGATDFGTTLVL